MESELPLPMPRVNSQDSRRKARIAALQSLFAADIKGAGGDTSLEWLAEEDSLPEIVVDFAHGLVTGVGENRESLDQVIQRYAPAWPVNQLSFVDRNILRMALYELLFTPAIPRKTAINEAVEVAKIFGSESSTRFINGVLGSVMTGLDLGEITSENTVPEGR